MKKVTVTLENGNSVELNAVIIERHLVIEGKIPAIITSDGKFLMQLHESGYWDYKTFKDVVALNAGTIPIQILSLEKYYIAHEQGKLSQLWEN
jgi:hypothetical protein